ncbi:MAG TPA: FAD-dependent oxidoreductase [Puia sp.]|nr:FAD-dependent oxidoreductase [Puia sp.]
MTHFVKKIKRLIQVSLPVIFLLIRTQSFGQTILKTDICIYGGTSAGVIAAYTAKKSGNNVILIEPGSHLGGLTSGGLGNTDIGNKYAITGLARDFYRRVGKHYGKFEQWTFEPHVAEDIMLDYIRVAGIRVLYHHGLVKVHKNGPVIQHITVAYLDKSGKLSANTKTIIARIFIDCSYEGDLMAQSGISYTVGRESNDLYGETYNGVQLLNKHQFPDGVDPYKIPGNPASGLLWGISPDTLEAKGRGDHRVQAYNFRLCLTDSIPNRLPITKPAGYDSTRYELLLRYLAIKNPKNLDDRVLNINHMPHRKTDINNNGPFSTDMIGMNYDYAEANFTERTKIVTAHINYTIGLLYFLGHDPRVPLYLRNEMLQWGYAKDEYKNNNHWSPQIYVREARRMIGAYIMTQANCQGKTIAEDTAGLAAYTMDSHNCQRIVVNGMVKNEGDVQIGGFGPYPVSYRSITPKEKECTNLLVPVCLSATHIAYGSIRMEPVFMVLAQTAAVAATVAIQKNIPVQMIDVSEIRSSLRSNPLADRSVPEILVDNDDSLHTKINGNWQRIKENGYGSSFLLHAGTDTEAFVRFIPQLQKKMKYQVYIYLPAIDHIAAKIPIKISDGKKEWQPQINTKNFSGELQTGGEWLRLGSYLFPDGEKSYLQISSNGTDGQVAADAVLFVPEKLK